MTIISENLRKWINYNIPIGEPLRLKEGAPEEVKREFEEWHQQKAEDEKKGIWR